MKAYYRYRGQMGGCQKGGGWGVGKIGDGEQNSGCQGWRKDLAAKGYWKGVLGG